MYLDGDLTATTPGGAQLDRHRIVCYQASLGRVWDGGASHEAQRVDLFVTRQWIRLLLWEYTARHFAMACHPADQAFSLFLPVKLGHELLSLFAVVSDASVKTHGYGVVSGCVFTCSTLSGNTKADA